MTKTFDFPIRVYMEDTDAGGVVFYANYLKFMERARTEMLVAYGCDHAAMIRDDKLMFLVRHVEIDYLKPARLADDLIISTSVSEMGNASLKMRQIVYKGEEIITEATIGLVCVTTEGKVCRIPAAIRDKFSITN